MSSTVKTSEKKLKVAVVEDVLIFRRAWREKLRGTTELSLFKSSSAFLESENCLEFDVIITDYHLGEDEPTGQELAERVRKNGFTGPIVLSSGVDSDIEGLSEKFDAFASKTELMTVEELLGLVERRMK